MLSEAPKKNLLLQSFGDSINVAVIGANGGIGQALVEQLSSSYCVKNIFSLSRKGNHDQPFNSKSIYIDLEDETSIANAASVIGKTVHELDVVCVATGILHSHNNLLPEKSWKTLDCGSMEAVFRINTIGPALVAKHFLPLLSVKKRSALAILTAKVGSISDNFLGGWYSYRASKAALNMIIRTLSIEMARQNADAVCVGLHPGTVDTNLSKPYQRGVEPGKLFSAKKSAKYLLQVLDSMSPKNSGFIYSWDGVELPY